MIEHYENQNKQAQQSSGQQSLLHNGKVKAPDYSAKARK